jgi:hypothetical protein
LEGTGCPEAGPTQKTYLPVRNSWGFWPYLLRILFRCNAGNAEIQQEKGKLARFLTRGTDPSLCVTMITQHPLEEESVKMPERPVLACCPASWENGLPVVGRLFSFSPFKGNDRSPVFGRP